MIRLNEIVASAETKEEVQKVVARLEAKPIEKFEMLILDCEGVSAKEAFLEPLLCWYRGKRSSEGKPALIFRGVSEDEKAMLGELAARLDLVLHVQDAPSFPAYRVQRLSD